MRLIDADGLLPMMKYATTDSEIGVFPVKIGFNEIAKVIDDAPTVDAIPVEWLYDLADKKEEEKDIKLSAMIKGVVALWHREKQNYE